MRMIEKKSVQTEKRIDVRKQFLKTLQLEPRQRLLVTTMRNRRFIVNIVLNFIVLGNQPHNTVWPRHYYHNASTRMMRNRG